MCTAISYNAKKHLFGRTLDYDFSYNETITVCPRNFPLYFREHKEITHHFAIIGMSTVAENYPLYYDAINEKGLGMAGLLFPDNAFYAPLSNSHINITPFEFIPWVLSQCKTVSEAKNLIEKTSLFASPFSKEFPLTPLHWFVADKSSSLTVECTKDGLHIYDNPVGVLTNNPPFNIQLFNLSNYIGLSPYEPENTFSKEFPISLYSRGMGSLGLPGDFSSISRFIKAAYIKTNSVSEETELDNISQFFHVLDSVCQIRGSVITPSNGLEITIYSSCCDTEKGIYYYKTYQNSHINGVDLNHENLDLSQLITYPLIRDNGITLQN